MSRKSARETAMKLLYEYSITGALSKDSLHDAPDVLDFEQLDEENLHYIDQVIDGFPQKQEEIDEIISQNSHAWKDVYKRQDLRRYTFVGKVHENLPEGYLKVEQRNKFSIGEKLEILSPSVENAFFTVTQIMDMDGNMQDSAPHPQQMIRINCPYTLHEGDLLRRHD